jgi:hypothetical protein
MDPISLFLPRILGKRDREGSRGERSGAPLLMPATRSTLAVSVGKPLDGQRLAGLPREQLLAELLEELRQVQERAERLRRKR